MDLPIVKCVSQPAVTPVSFTLVNLNEKYEADKDKYKQNMERMTKIVEGYKLELDKARKDLKDAKVKVTRTGFGG